MLDEDEITIEIEDDGAAAIVETPVAKPAETKTAKAPAPVLTDDPQAGIDDLRRQIDAKTQEAQAATERANREARARADADRRAAAAAAEAKEARTVAGDSQYDAIVNALTANERELEQLQSLKAGALERGEYAEAAKMDGQMAKVGARIVNLENGKMSIEEQRKAAPASTRQEPHTDAPNPADQRETWLAGLPPASADWIRAHPRFFTDGDFQRKVMAAAQFAENVKGLNHNAPEYFRFIEAESGLTPSTTASTTTTTAAPLSTAATNVQTRSSPVKPAVAATPSRSVPDTPAGPPRAVTLSREEREIAHLMHPKMKPTDPDPEVVYARNKLALLREGHPGYTGRG